MRPFELLSEQPWSGEEQELRQALQAWNELVLVELGKRPIAAGSDD